MKNTIIKSVFALALACSGASCTGNYLEINSNPYEVTEDEMQRKGYAISSYLNAIFGTIISPDVNTTQFTDALLGGTQGGYFADRRTVGRRPSPITTRRTTGRACSCTATGSSRCFTAT